MLQCLEGQFYSCAVYGKPLSSELTGGGPAPIGCEMANLTDYMGIAKVRIDQDPPNMIWWWCRLSRLPLRPTNLKVSQTRCPAGIFWTLLQLSFQN